MKFKDKLKLGVKYILPRPWRAFNLLLLRFSKYFRLTKVFGKPITAMIEPTNYCNLKCPLCPTGQGLIERPKEAMKFEDFKRILDNIGGSIIHLRLWNWGEPLIDKDLPKMIRYAKSKRIFVNTSTNSFFLEDEKVMKNLINSGLDQLIVSLDGASKETYNQYRKNGDFDKVVRVLKMAAQMKKDLGTKYPEIKLQFIVMKHNEHEINKMIALAKEVKADTLFLKTVGVMDPRLRKQIKKYMPSNPKFRRYVDMGDDLKPVPLAGKVCDYLWEEITVNVDGSVVPCCRDAHGKYVFGNLKTQKLGEIWNGSRMVNFRKKVLSGKSEIDICRLCSGSNKDFHIAEIKLNC
jgi:radical SAM protein with 4Fe4S-binding SPASM domain